MSNANQIHSDHNFEHQQNSNEQIDTGTASSNAFRGGFLAIAAAYGDYSKKSFEDTKMFVEKLSGVKSLDETIEVQTEFAKAAFETFVTQSQTIGVLYSDLAEQSYKPFGDFVAKMPPTNR
ncbi:phasin family protein [Bradyrhizobium japonicum]|uniref:phasin family protein n=1 Tax=Bradyrhizobium japonicum TaxID=375 RepID=UPI003B67AD3D